MVTSPMTIVMATNARGAPVAWLARSRVLVEPYVIGRIASVNGIDLAGPLSRKYPPKIPDKCR